MKRLLITGSRDWDDFPVIVNAIATAVLESGDQSWVIVHGTARGADQMSEWAASVFNDSYPDHMPLLVERHPADWSLGKRAGFLRNREMVDGGANICLAFIKNNSRGATMCADLAEKHGIPVRRYFAA